MNETLKTLKTVGLLLWNKGVAILVLAFLMYRYATLNTEQPTPFAELLYVTILIAAVIVVAPVIRLLVFAEASELAEGKGLRELLAGQVVTPALKHYWFATAISYAVTALCVSHLL